MEWSLRNETHDKQEQDALDEKKRKRKIVNIPNSINI